MDSLKSLVLSIGYPVINHIKVLADYKIYASFYYNVKHVFLSVICAAPSTSVCKHVYELKLIDVDSSVLIEGTTPPN